MGTFRERLTGALRRFARAEYESLCDVLKASKRVWRTVAVLYVVLIAIALMLSSWKVVILTYVVWLVAIVFGGWAVLNAVMHLPIRFISIQPDQLRRWMLGLAIGGIPVAIFAGIASY